MPGSGVDFLPFVLAGSTLCSGFSTAGGSPRTEAHQICRATQETGWALSASPTCVCNLTPSLPANGSPS